MFLSLRCCVKSRSHSILEAVTASKIDQNSIRCFTHTTWTWPISQCRYFFVLRTEPADTSFQSTNAREEGHTWDLVTLLLLLPNSGFVAVVVESFSINFKTKTNHRPARPSHQQCQRPSHASQHYPHRTNFQANLAKSATHLKTRGIIKATLNLLKNLGTTRLQWRPRTVHGSAPNASSPFGMAQRRQSDWPHPHAKNNRHRLNTCLPKESIGDPALMARREGWLLQTDVVAEKHP